MANFIVSEKEKRILQMVLCPKYRDSVVIDANRFSINGDVIDSFISYIDWTFSRFNLVSDEEIILVKKMSEQIKNSS